MDTGHAQLMICGASRLAEPDYADVWDEAMRFAFGAGWEPRQDEADVYVRETDTEFYVLVEAAEEEEDDDDLELDLRDSNAG